MELFENIPLRQKGQTLANRLIETGTKMTHLKHSKQTNKPLQSLITA